MKDMVLSNRYSTFQELVTDYDLESWEWAYSINDNRSITFEIPLTNRNKIIYDKLLTKNDNRELHLNRHAQEYILTNVICGKYLTRN